MPILVNVHALKIVKHEQLVNKKPFIALRQAAGIRNCFVTPTRTLWFQRITVAHVSDLGAIRYKRSKHNPVA